MKPATSELVFTHTPASVVGALLFVLVVVVLAFIAWRRSGWRTTICILECLRILVAVGIAITLNQPEWRETFKPESKPVIAVLHDVSGSMETRDILNPKEPAAEARTRLETAAPLTDPALWKPLAERMDTVIEPFSSKEDIFLNLRYSFLHSLCSGSLFKHCRKWA